MVTCNESWCKVQITFVEYFKTHTRYQVDYKHTIPYYLRRDIWNITSGLYTCTNAHPKERTKKKEGQEGNCKTEL